MVVHIRHKRTDKIQVGQEFRVSKAMTIKVQSISIPHASVGNPDVIITPCNCFVLLDTFSLPTDPSLDHWKNIL